MDQSNALQSQQLNILLELAARRDGQGGSGGVGGSGQVALPPPRFGDLAESAAAQVTQCLPGLETSLHPNVIANWNTPQTSDIK